MKLLVVCALKLFNCTFPLSIFLQIVFKADVPSTPSGLEISVDDIVVASSCWSGEYAGLKAHVQPARGCSAAGF